MDFSLPPIPPKRYFTIGEVSELCGVKPHVLRYWEQEFAQLRPVKRRGNRRYYQRHEVLLIRRIRELLHGQGFTISGARNRLAELGPAGLRALEDEHDQALAEAQAASAVAPAEPGSSPPSAPLPAPSPWPQWPEGRPLTPEEWRAELLAIRALLE
jgi:DNA-binding transcriptional MerR regulator